MSAPAKEGGGGGGEKAAPKKEKDPYVDLAERIFVQMSAIVYDPFAGAGQKKPDPKALAALCFKLADAFEKATDETPRRLAEIEAANKASVKLEEVDLSSVFAASTANAAAVKAAAAAAPAAPPAEAAKK
jgi:hypothetical protein